MADIEHELLEKARPQQCDNCHIQREWLVGFTVGRWGDECYESIEVVLCSECLKLMVGIAEATE